MLRQCHKNLVGTHATGEPEQAYVYACRQAGKPVADKHVATATTASLAAKRQMVRFTCCASSKTNMRVDDFLDPPHFAACSSSTFVRPLLPED